MSEKRVIYTSALCPTLDEGDVIAILRQARANNSRVDVTGILVWGKGQLIQCLEGEAAVIDRLIGKIAADQRHHGMEIVAEAATDKRLFANWAMGYVALSEEELSDRIGALGVLSADEVNDRLQRDTDIATTFIAGFVSVLRGQGVEIGGYLKNRKAPVERLFPVDASAP